MSGFFSHLANREVWLTAAVAAMVALVVARFATGAYLWTWALGAFVVIALVMALIRSARSG